jgi:hypothetical protein
LCSNGERLHLTVAMNDVEATFSAAHVVSRLTSEGKERRRGT